MKQSILNLNPETYQRHLIHGPDRIWAETNCYSDVWIELLHAMGHEPIASLPFTLVIDFEGDQWTFFKFPLVDLYELYGLDVQELTIWNHLIDHVEEQVSYGRPVLVEMDSYYLPDTHGTAYHMAHVKSTIAVVEIDIENRHLGYFHNQGYYNLSNDDFVNLFRLNQNDPVYLPPYVEFVKVWDRAKKNRDLVDASIRVLRKQLTFIPNKNPFHAFAERLTKDLNWLSSESIDMFHQYSFVTLRQLGACYELSKTYLQWLAQNGESGLDEAITLFDEISTSAKTSQFQLARAVSKKKPLDFAPIEKMGQAWQTATNILLTKYT
ncbi:MAG TPA: DUF1839 family protein [Anaerolineales bacterium]|nr:DUF1839 family protein [Anaerolineales bacterium]